MQDLTLVGLTEDKKKLVLVSDSGEEYTLPADARLRAALRGDHARLGQLEIQMESALRPRDIQARIRSGESPESVAAAAQTTVDRIMGYATPVLAERAHIAQRAQGSSVRRKAGEGPARTLGDAVAERLRSRNVDPDSVEWDAWRREDGRWVLVADYRSGGSAHHAEFVFDAPGRYVVAEDDEARWLVGEQSPRKGPQPRPAGNQRRLSAVGQEEELPLGADAIGMVSDLEDLDEPAGDETVLADEPTVDLSQAAGAVRERGASATSEYGAANGAATGDADWMATQASDRPSRRASPEREQSPEQSLPQSTGQASGPASDSAPDQRPDPAREASAEAEATEPEQAEAPAKKSKKKGRASVPSWDEIMFGGGRSD